MNCIYYNNNFSGATHQEAVNALRSCGNVIYLVVCKGYDRVDVDKAVAEGRLARTGSVSSRSQSVSSLDVPDEDIQQVCDILLAEKMARGGLNIKKK